VKERLFTHCKYRFDCERSSEHSISALQLENNVKSFFEVALLGSPRRSIVELTANPINLILRSLNEHTKHLHLSFFSFTLWKSEAFWPLEHLVELKTGSNCKVETDFGHTLSLY
jgi:hypothetical protein